MQKRLFSYTEDTYPESILNRLLIRWLNSLNLWKKLSVESFVKEFSNGLLLIKIIKFLKPSTKFPGIYEKPLAKKACMHNIEQGLSIIWQLNAKKRFIPTADEIYEGKSQKVWKLLHEIFQALAMHDVRILTKQIVLWIEESLAHFGINLPPAAKSGNFQAIQGSFENGVLLAVILYCYSDGEKVAARPDFTKLYQSPSNRSQLESNIEYVFSKAQAQQLPIYFTANQFIDFPNPEFLMLQLYFYFCELKGVDKARAIPLKFKEARRDRGSFGFDGSYTDSPLTQLLNNARNRETPDAITEASVETLEDHKSSTNTLLSRNTANPKIGNRTFSPLPKGTAGEDGMNYSKSYSKASPSKQQVPKAFFSSFMYSKINKFKLGVEKSAPPSRMETNSPYSTNDLYYTNSSRLSNRTNSPIPVDSTQSSIKPPPGPQLVLKKTQELLQKSGFSKARQNIEESVERVVRKPVDKRIAHPSGSYAGEVKNVQAIQIKPVKYSKWQLERQQMMLDDFLRHQELNEIVVMEEGPKQVSSLAGTLQNLSKPLSLYSTGNMTAHFRKADANQEKNPYLSQASLDNFLQVQENLGIMSKQSPASTFVNQPSTPSEIKTQIDKISSHVKGPQISPFRPEESKYKDLSGNNRYAVPSLSDINSTHPTSATHIPQSHGSQLCFLMTPRLLQLSLNGEPAIEYFVKVAPTVTTAAIMGSQIIGRSVTGSSSGSANLSSDPSETFARSKNFLKFEKSLSLVWCETLGLTEVGRINFERIQGAQILDESGAFCIMARPEPKQTKITVVVVRTGNQELAQLYIESLNYLAELIREKSQRKKKKWGGTRRLDF